MQILKFKGAFFDHDYFKMYFLDTQNNGLKFLLQNRIKFVFYSFKVLLYINGFYSNLLLVLYYCSKQKWKSTNLGLSCKCGGLKRDPAIVFFCQRKKRKF